MLILMRGLPEGCIVIYHNAEGIYRFVPVQAVIEF